MGEKQRKIRGALLGLAAGDAMGHTVDSLSLEEIRADYGPNGLLGYDLVNGYADVTSYTQVAAFSANGLLLGLTRGQLQGNAAALVRYVALALREWSRSQHYTTPDKKHCWLSQVPELTRRFCMDSWMLDALSKEALGSPEQPQNKSKHPGALTAAVPIALLWQDLGLEQEELDRLGARVVSLTHGDPEAFLSGAVLTHLLSTLLRRPNTPIWDLVQEATEAITSQFGEACSQTAKLTSLLQLALALSADTALSPVDAMEQLGCTTAAEVLAGAVYACATCGRDFDAALITAVNHSGHSAAVGAIAGCMLGAVLEDEALPEFYLECLEPAPALSELAEDMSAGFSAMVEKSLFDMDWERKYVSTGR